MILTTALAISASAVAVAQKPNTFNPKVFALKTPVATTLITLNKLKAFPTAEGAGAEASGGRDPEGKVIYVTNRASSGSGSLKEALETEGSRTIVFAIGGRFNVNRSINLGNYKEGTDADRFSNFTLAGQTANDKGGVHLTQSNFSRCIGQYGERAVNVSRQNNMILRYFDARYNWQLATPPEHAPENHGCANGYSLHQDPVPTLRFIEPENLIIDHLSSGWSGYGLVILDSKFSLSDRGEMNNISVQRSLMHEGVHVPSSLDWRFPNPTRNDPNRTSRLQHNHNIGMLLGFRGRRGFSDPAGTVEDWNKIGNFSIHKNAFVGISHRLPNIAGGDNARFRVINNYIYGFDGDGTGKRLSRVGGNAHNDLVGNVYQQAGYSPDFTTKNLMGFRFDNFMPSDPLIEEHPNFYIHDNLFLDKQGERHSITDTVNSDVRNMLYFRGDRNGVTRNRGDNLNEEDHGLILRNDENEPLLYPVSQLTTTDVKTNILLNVGGNVRFKTDGSTYIDDPIDTKYISWASDNAGPTYITKVPTDDGLGNTRHFKYPDYHSSDEVIDPKTFDFDEDGMPDQWESKHQLEPKISNNNHVSMGKTWDFGPYKVVNNAGYSDLEMYLADIAGDFHILAKTEGVPLNSIVDDLTSINMPSEIEAGRTVDVAIEYSAKTDRQLKCYFQEYKVMDLNPKWVSQAFSINNVEQGSGTATCKVDIPRDIGTTNHARQPNLYRLYAYITESNGRWTKRKDTMIKTGITISDTKDLIVSVDMPSTVTAGDTIDVPIQYLALGDRQIKCFFRDDQSPWTTHSFWKGNVQAGSGVPELDYFGTTHCKVKVPENLSVNGIYQLYIYITEPNGRWSLRKDTFTQQGITVKP